MTSIMFKFGQTDRQIEQLIVNAYFNKLTDRKEKLLNIMSDVIYREMMTHYKSEY